METDTFAVMNDVWVIVGYPAPCRLCGCDLTEAGPKFSLFWGKGLSTRPDYIAAFETLVGPVVRPTAICSACRDLLGSYVQTKATLDQICTEIKSKACETHKVQMDTAVKTERPDHQVVRATSVIDCATAVVQIKTEHSYYDYGDDGGERPVCGSSTAGMTHMNTTPLKLQTPTCPDALKCVMFPKSCSTPPQTQTPAFEKRVQIAVVTCNSKRTRILRGNQHVVHPLMAVPGVAPSVVTAVLELMKKECKDLRDRGSVLKHTSASSLAQFEWDKVVEELENLAPTLLRFLRAACGMADSWKPETIADLDKENRMAMAGSILLNVRYPSMNAPLYVNGIDLYKAGVKRRTFTSLQRIGFCMDYQNILAKLRESAEGRLFVRRGHTGHTPASAVESTVDTEEQETFEQDHKGGKTQDTEAEVEHDYQRPLDSEAESLDPEPHSGPPDSSTASSQSCLSPRQEKFEQDHTGGKTPDTEDEVEHDHQRPLDSEEESLDPEPHSGPPDSSTASSQSCLSPRQLGLHITVQMRGIIPQLEKCGNCCTAYHCPFCKPGVFQPTFRSRVLTHLDRHKRRAVQHKDHTIFKCNLECRGNGHFHCPSCKTTHFEKRNRFIAHLALCRSSFHSTETLHVDGGGGESNVKELVVHDIEMEEVVERAASTNHAASEKNAISTDTDEPAIKYQVDIVEAASENQEKFEQDHKGGNRPDTEDEVEHDYQRLLDSEAESLDPEPHSGPPDGSTASSQSCLSPRQLGLHITVQMRGIIPQLEPCVNCCTAYHCPFCKPGVFKPTIRSKVLIHLDRHKRRAVQHKDHTIFKCNLECRGNGHFHCPSCKTTHFEKRNRFTAHLALCRSSFHSTETLHVDGGGGESNVKELVVRAASENTISTDTDEPAIKVVIVEATSENQVINMHDATGATVHVRRSKIISVACPQCAVVINKKNLKMHMKRKHSEPDCRMGTIQYGSDEEELTDMEEPAKSKKRRTNTETLDIFTALSRPLKVMRKNRDDDA